MTIDSRPEGETIGQRLRRLRLEQGLSQRSLSGPGLTHAYISRIEADARQPSVRVLRVLATKLGVTASYLETGSELAESDSRELRLADAELRLRLEGEASTAELESILEEAVAFADLPIAVRARISLGLHAAGQNDHVTAIDEFERAIESGLISPAARPDVYAALGECYALSGEPQRAAGLFERSLADLERIAPDDFANRVRFSTYLSYALTDLGDLDRAAAVVEEVLAFAGEGADPYTRVRLYWSLGRISHEQAKPLIALDYFRRAVALLETTEDTFQIARAYLSCAAAMLAAGQNLIEASRQIDSAERLLGARPEPRDIAVVHRLRATHGVRVGDFAAAELNARRAHTLTVDLPNQHGLATWALADALAGQGDPAAGDAYAEATRLLREHGTPREQIEVLRAHAHYLRIHDQERSALDLLEEATRVASALPHNRRRSPSLASGA